MQLQGADKVFNLASLSGCAPFGILPPSRLGGGIHGIWGVLGPQGDGAWGGLPTQGDGVSQRWVVGEIGKEMGNRSLELRTIL